VRGQNGYKCHIMSEAHLRMVKVFGEAPKHFVDNFSQQFQSNFLRLLRMRFGTRRVHANVVYNEFIKDKEHIHMNSTRWATLGDLCQYLAREGYVRAECTDKGWFITYLDRDPETLARQEALEREERHRLSEEQRNQRAIEEMVRRGLERERAAQAAASPADDADDDDHPDGDTEETDEHSEGEGSSSAEQERSSSASPLDPGRPKLAFALQPAVSAGASVEQSLERDKETASAPAVAVFSEESLPSLTMPLSAGDRKRPSALDEIMHQEMQKKARADAAKVEPIVLPNWLHVCV
jgi:DNA/RNA-binding protein KIN17